MDEDEYDIDDYDEDLDEIDEIDELDEADERDDYDEDLDEDEDLDDDEISDDEIEMAGSLDGEFDARYSDMYGQYGSSTDFDDLSDEQKDLYDTAYHASHDKNI